MIRKLIEQNRNQILNYLYRDPSINIFIIGDIENFGFDTDFQDVWADFIDGEINSTLLRYRQNIIYYSHKTMFNEDWLDIIKTINYQFISGCKRLTDVLHPYFPSMKEKPMYFCECNEVLFDKIESNNVIDVQKDKDIGLVFDLLSTIEEFDSFKDTTKDQFIEQKKNTLQYSKMYMIEEDEKCVSTVSTVADTTKSAMVVAVATDPNYRNKGYASTLMKHLIQEYLLEKKKSLCLFYDNPAAGKIYKRLGFVDKDKWVMLLKE